MLPPAFIVSSFDFHIRHTFSLLCLTVLVLEYLRTCRFEFTYIWSRPVNISKVLYVVSRYYEILGKAVHYSLIHLILRRSLTGITAQNCAIWYNLMLSQSILMVLILDIILLLRVTPYAFAIYNAASLWVHRLEMFDGLCNIAIHAPSLLTMNLIRYNTFLASHVLIWICLYVNRNVGQGHVPVVKLVVREGSWIFVILFAIVALLLPPSIAVMTENPFMTYICPTTLVSILVSTMLEFLDPDNILSS
ncbi:hypothetical protein BJ165DRAFT_1532223 [Panaeolus papilionaceus]|nr:hypothetical protein BJ165DRAFT_1532223 [Panaeolus papilionaceus]